MSLGSIRGSEDYVEETSIERAMRMFYTGLFGVLYTMSKVRGGAQAARRVR